MPAIYIKEQGSMLMKRDKRLVVGKSGRTLLDIPIANIDNIAIIGNVQISTQALIMLMEKGIDISYFTFSGKYIGHTSADMSKNIFLRFAQHEYYHNMEKRLEMAREIVRNKVCNQIQLIRTHHWLEKYTWREDVEKMESLIETLSDRKTSNEILGIEGMCSNIYFGAYGHMFQCRIAFQGRNRRPPRDPINVILSLGYTFLTKEVCSSLEAESFEMYLGFLHGIRYGRKSLALDIVEEFRQPFIDRMVLRCFNKGMFSEYDFDTEGDGIVLTEDGFCKFCRIYGDWLQDSHYSGEKSSFKELIRKQVANLKKTMQKNEVYIPFSWKK